METQTKREVATISSDAAQISGAQALIKSLVEEKVDLIFGYPGGAIMPIYDALYDYSEHIRHILVRHEQGAVHAAQGYSRTSGKTGVCFATSGPGATNLVTGIADAMCDSTPLVCITGQVASHLLGTDAFQESDVIGITMPVTKWNYQITRAEEIPGVLARAFYIARTGRPGPVLIDITKDAQFGKCTWRYSPCTYIRSYQPVPKLNIEKLKEAARLIALAKRPYILSGQGVLLSGAGAELVAFAEKGGIPVASTLLGLSGMPAGHPLYVGYLGMHGNYGANVKIGEADLIIAVGMRFDDRVTGDVTQFARQAKVIHIEIDESEINKIIPADVSVHADARMALAALTGMISPQAYPEWLKGFLACDQMEYEQVIEGEMFPLDGKIRMAEVIGMISEKTLGQAVIVSDVGQHQMVTARYYKYQTPYTNITSGGLGTMGFALPAAIGARLGSKAGQVIAVIGDGGFQMTLQELGTINQSKVPVKIIILNNEFLGMVRQWQQLFFEKRYSFTEMVNPDFIQIAKGFYIEAERVSHRQALSEAIDRMLAHTGSYLLEVVVEKEENVFPMVPAGAPISHIRLS